MHLAAWFERPELLSIWLQDFIHAQMKLLRPDFARLPPLDEAALLDRQHAGIDSIEWVELASALFIALDAEDTGALRAHAEQRGQLGARYADWIGFARNAAALAPLLFFQTSGSTGAPKWHRHRMHDLLREVTEVAALLQLRGDTPRRVISVMPAHHIYGFLFGVLLPAAFGWPALHPRGLTPSQVRVMLQPGDLVVAHPAFWHVALDARRWPDSIIGLSAGQALPASAFVAAAQVGLSRLFELYGATETAGVGWRDGPGDFTLLSRYQPFEAALIDLWQQPPSRCELPDLLQSNGQQFSVVARKDQLVQVAGQNVSIAHVEQTLRSFPGVEAARVRLFSPNEVSALARLHAFVVPADIDAIALRTYATQKLDAAAMPQTITFGDALPISDGGKAASWPIQPKAS